MSALPQNNLTYPVLISAGTGGNGSGFYLNTDDAMYLVTACHVLFKNNLELYPGIVHLTSLASDFTSKAHFELDGAQLLASGTLKKHPTADVAVCKIANIASPTDRTMGLLPGSR
ncbi:hypothetical protein [Bradyrhizobium sp. RDI18]|uniref:hypothetical protein n=1 Tax=Bradyrhizobium sp. RDI18 TaxID=3367400 RepID=UPI0037201C8A